MTIYQIPNYCIELANIPTSWQSSYSEEDFCVTFLHETDRVVMDYQAKLACNESPIINAIRYRVIQEARCACIDKLNQLRGGN